MSITIVNDTIVEYFRDKSIEQWILCFMRLEKDICERNGCTDTTDGKWMLQQMERMYKDHTHHLLESTRQITREQNQLQNDTLQTISNLKREQQQLQSDYQMQLSKLNEAHTSVQTTFMQAMRDIVTQSSDQGKDLRSMLSKTSMDHETQQQVLREAVQKFKEFDAAQSHRHEELLNEAVRKLSEVGECHNNDLIGALRKDIPAQELHHQQMMQDCLSKLCEITTKQQKHVVDALDDRLPHQMRSVYTSIHTNDNATLLNGLATLIRNTGNTDVLSNLNDLREKFVQEQMYRKQSQQQMEALLGTLDSQRRKMEDIATHAANVDTWVEKMSGKNSSVKGAVGQRTYVQLLNDHFSADVTEVGSTEKSTDIDFDMQDRPPIRMEIKNYASKNIPGKEIGKFHRDLIQQGRHGILISMDSRVAGHEDFTFELVGTHSKFVAFYLCKSGLDMDRLTLALNFVYTLASLVVKDGQAAANTYTPDEIDRVCQRLQQCDRQVSELVEMHQRSLNVLSDMSSQQMLAILQKKYDATHTSVKTKLPRLTCTECGKEVAGQSGLSRHKKECPARKKKSTATSDTNTTSTTTGQTVVV